MPPLAASSLVSSVSSLPCPFGPVPGFDLKQRQAWPLLGRTGPALRRPVHYRTCYALSGVRVVPRQISMFPPDEQVQHGGTTLQTSVSNGFDEDKFIPSIREAGTASMPLGCWSFSWLVSCWA